MNNKVVYVASPYGFSEAGRHFLKYTIIPVLSKAGIIIFDPWNSTPKNITAPVTDLPFSSEKKQRLAELNKIIGKNNTDGILKSDAMFAVLDGTDVDSGTAAEIGFASAHNIPILGYRGDFRLSSDNEGSLINLQVEYFIYRSGGKIITEINQLDNALNELFELN